MSCPDIIAYNRATFIQGVKKSNIYIDEFLLDSIRLGDIEKYPLIAETIWSNYQVILKRAAAATSASLQKESSPKPLNTYSQNTATDKSTTSVESIDSYSHSIPDEEYVPKEVSFLAQLRWLLDMVNSSLLLLEVNSELKNEVECMILQLNNNVRNISIYYITWAIHQKF